MNAHVAQSGTLAQPPPWTLHVGEMLSFNLAGNDIRVPLNPGDGLENIGGGLADRDQLRAALGIRQPQHPGVQIDIGPFKFLDLAEAAAGQQEQLDAVNGLAFRIGLAQHLAEPGQFLGGEVALALLFLVAFDLPAGVHPVSADIPGVGDREHDGEDAEGPVGLVGRRFHRLMKLDDVGPCHVDDPVAADLWIDEQLD